MLSRMTNDFMPLLRLQSDMNRLFEHFFDDSPAGRGYAASYPAVNLWEDGEAAWVEAELPGLRLDDLDVSVMGRDVTIGGQRKFAEQPEAAYHRRERAQGQFTRTVTLPWDIDADKVEAKLTDGVLTLRLPKCESCRPKKVKVLSA